MPPRLRFWVIADDLTGALDTAAPFAAHGWRTTVVPWPGAAPRAIAAAVRQAAAISDVVVVDTASRYLAAPEAARRVRTVVRLARRRVAGQATPYLYKKIDSTLRGNVSAELAAFRAATGVACLPIAPAFPAQGRTTHGGAVWVDGAPLAASPAARDACGPAASADLARLAPVGALDVFDAATNADLRAIASRLARESRLGAVAGSGGLAEAIAARFGLAQRPLAAHVASGAMLVVSGSAHPAARAQIRALVVSGALGLIVPIDSRTRPRDRRATEMLAAGALRAGRTVALVCPALADGVRVPRRRASTAAARLAATARALIEGAPVGALITVGGDTTAALAAAMRWAPLTVHGAMAPGIAVVRLGDPPRRATAAGPRWLITKSGAFGDPQTLRRIVRRFTFAPRSGRPPTLR